VTASLLLTFAAGASTALIFCEVVVGPHGRQPAYQGQNLADWCRATGDWTLEVVERTSGMHGWSQQPKRWIVERIFAWLLRNRRLVVDYERTVQTSETLIEVAMSRLLVVRLGRRMLSRTRRSADEFPPTCGYISW
jgi:Transposase DDE domain